MSTKWRMLVQFHFWYNFWQAKNNIRSCAQAFAVYAGSFFFICIFVSMKNYDIMYVWQGTKRQDNMACIKSVVEANDKKIVAVHKGFIKWKAVSKPTNALATMASEHRKRPALKMGRQSARVAMPGSSLLRIRYRVLVRCGGLVRWLCVPLAHISNELMHVCSVRCGECQELQQGVWGVEL